MNVMIIGASGFIGKHLFSHYLKHGANLCAVTSSSVGLEEYAGMDHVEVVKASFDDYDKLSQMVTMRNIDMLYYLSWVGYGASTNDYAVQIRNIKPVCDAVNEAAKIGCKRFVFSSSFYEFMIAEDDTKSHDDGAYCSVYGSAKHAARVLAQAISAQRGVEFVCVAFANTFGPGDQSKRSTNSLIRKLLRREALDLTEGKHLYDWNYIDDCINGLVLAGEKGVVDAFYYLGSNERRPLKDIVSDVRDYIAPNIELHLGTYKEQFHVDYTCIDADKLYRDTGYMAKTDFKEAIERTAEWIKTMPRD